MCFSLWYVCLTCSRRSYRENSLEMAAILKRFYLYSHLVRLVTVNWKPLIHFYYTFNSSNRTLFVLVLEFHWVLSDILTTILLGKESDSHFSRLELSESSWKFSLKNMVWGVNEAFHQLSIMINWQILLKQSFFRELILISFKLKSNDWYLKLDNNLLLNSATWRLELYS